MYVYLHLHLYIHETWIEGERERGEMSACAIDNRSIDNPRPSSHFLHNLNTLGLYYIIS